MSMMEPGTIQQLLKTPVVPLEKMGKDNLESKKSLNFIETVVTSTSSVFCDLCGKEGEEEDNSSNSYSFLTPGEKGLLNGFLKDNKTDEREVVLSSFCSSCMEGVKEVLILDGKIRKLKEQLKDKITALKAVLKWSRKGKNKKKNAAKIVHTLKKEEEWEGRGYLAPEVTVKIEEEGSDDEVQEYGSYHDDEAHHNYQLSSSDSEVGDPEDSLISVIPDVLQPRGKRRTSEKCNNDDDDDYGISDKNVKGSKKSGLRIRRGTIKSVQVSLSPTRDDDDGDKDYNEDEEDDGSSENEEDDDDGDYKGPPVKRRKNVDGRKKIGFQDFDIEYPPDNGAPPYPCYCKSTFSRRKARNEHYRFKHLRMAKFSCETCNKIYRRKAELDHHLAANCDHRQNMKTTVELKAPLGEVESEANCVCGECGRVFPSKATLKRHKTNVHDSNRQGGRQRNSRLEGIEYPVFPGDNGTPPFPCVCGSKFSRRKARDFHYRFKHLGMAKYSCELCNKKFIRKAELEYHLTTDKHLKNLEGLVDPTEGVEAAVICKLCSRGFISQAALNRHDKVVHQKKNKEDQDEQQSEQLTCQICDNGKVYSSRYQLQYHMARHGTKIMCEECGKMFPNKDELNIHKKRVHEPNGIPMVKCPLCSKLLKGGKVLSEHLHKRHNATKDDLTHKPKLCTKCNIEFKTNNERLVHERVVHKGLPAYKCNECGKEFPSNSYLLTHSVQHTGEKNYRCIKCGMTFAQFSTLRVHQRRIIDCTAVRPPPKHKPRKRNRNRSKKPRPVIPAEIMGIQQQQPPPPQLPQPPTFSYIHY